MKNLILTSIILLASASAMADRLVTFSDGSTAWENSNGHVYGKTPSPNYNRNHDSGANARPPIVDTQNGTVHVPVAGGYINTQNGKFTPGR